MGTKIRDTAIGDIMSIFHCDWRDKDGFPCGRKPYAEIFPIEEDQDEEKIPGWDYNYPKFEGSWSYLCLRHYIIAKLKGHKFCWCRVDTDRETMEHIKEKLWDIESDLYDIKDKLGIKTEYVELDKMKELWDNTEDEDFDIPLTEEDWNKRVQEKLKEKSKRKRKKE